MEFCVPERLPTYAGMLNSAIGVVSIVTPLLGAWLASVDYGILFALSAGVNLVGWAALHWWVAEPRWAHST